MSYRDRFFEKYSSTHIVHRKGVATLDQFRVRAAYYQQRWSKFFPKDKTAQILDAGCGDGNLVWWLQQSGFVNAEGIDLSSEQVETARQLGVKNVAQADLRVFLKARVGTYDVIVLRDVIEHFRKEEIVEVLELCHRSLKQSGTLIIQVPNAEAPFFGRIRYGDFTHEIALCVSSLAQLFNVVGMNRFQFYSTTPAIYGVKSLFQLGLWKLVETFYKFLLFAELGYGQRIVTQGIIGVATKTDS